MSVILYKSFPSSKMGDEKGEDAQARVHVDATGQLWSLFTAVPPSP